MNLLRRAVPILRLLKRNFAKEAKEVPKVKVNSGFAKLKETQKRFSIDDGVPVYLKNGITDKILYQTSWILVIVGLGLSVKLFVDFIIRDLDLQGKDDKKEKGDEDKTETEGE